MSKFKIGDRVQSYQGKGTIIDIDIDSFYDDGDYLVEYDEKIPLGHNGNHFKYKKGKDGHCWWEFGRDLKLIEETSSTIRLEKNEGEPNTKVNKHLEIAKRIEKQFNRTNDLIILKESLVDAVIDYDAGYNEDKLSQILSIMSNKAIEMIIELDDSLTYKDVYMQLNQIYRDKNHDYGDSFGETFEELGAISAVTRITDKINRLESLTTKEQRVKDESILDTLIDLANYCIMTLIELEEEE